MTLKFDFYENEKESLLLKEQELEANTVKNNLIVNFIPRAMDEDQLRQLFEPYGSLESVKLVKDRTSSKDFFWKCSLKFLTQI